LLKQYPDYFQALQIALMHGTNFKDLVMGITFTYFAYFLTINSYKDRKNRPLNIHDDPFNQIKNEEGTAAAILLSDQDHITQNPNSEN